MKNYIGYKAEGMGFDAHLTLLYTGDLDSPLLLKYAESLVDRYGHTDGLEVIRDEIIMFGTNPVVLLEVPLMLTEIHNLFVKHWPVVHSNAWRPHITIKYNHDDTILIPKRIRLHSLGVY